MMKRYFSKAVLAVILVSLTTGFSTTAVAAGDAEAGKIKSANCVACHGAEGISNNPSQPHLAGQVPGYIAKQLAAFKSGERENGIMLGFAAGLSEEDMADLDAFYSSQPAPESKPLAEANYELSDMGKQIYKGGIAKREVPACISCHGKLGHGIPKVYPRVIGQHEQYLESQLLMFKKGERKGHNEIMSDISFNLSEKEIKALSVYMAYGFCNQPSKQQLELGLVKEGELSCEIESTEAK